MCHIRESDANVAHTCRTRSAQQGMLPTSAIVNRLRLSDTLGILRTGARVAMRIVITCTCITLGRQKTYVFLPTLRDDWSCNPCTVQMEQKPVLGSCGADFWLNRSECKYYFSILYYLMFGKDATEKNDRRSEECNSTKQKIVSTHISLSRARPGSNWSSSCKL
jgi:hypothetical protein